MQCAKLTLWSFEYPDQEHDRLSTEGALASLITSLGSFRHSSRPLQNAELVNMNCHQIHSNRCGPTRYCHLVMQQILFHGSLNILPQKLIIYITSTFFTNFCHLFDSCKLRFDCCYTWLLTHVEQRGREWRNHGRKWFHGWADCLN